MIRKAADCQKKHNEKMRGGNGVVTITNERELSYLMKGEALYNDTGTEYTVTAGDVMICPAGTGHGVANNGTEDVELCAVILYA